MDTDPITRLQADWRSEVPDLDTSAMATVARITRAGGLIRKRIDAHMAEFGSGTAEFDVLSALRRHGPPYRMKPSELARAIMLSPSGMTHRLDLLEAAGLVERVADPTSRRTAPVALTPLGIETAEQMARQLVEIESVLMGALTTSQRTDLDALLSELIGSLTNAD